MNNDTPTALFARRMTAQRDKLRDALNAIVQWYGDSSCTKARAIAAQALDELATDIEALAKLPPEARQEHPEGFYSPEQWASFDPHLFVYTENIGSIERVLRRARTDVLALNAELTRLKEEQAGRDALTDAYRRMAGADKSGSVRHAVRREPDEGDYDLGLDGRPNRERP